MIVISVFPPEGAFEISLFANPYLAPSEGRGAFRLSVFLIEYADDQIVEVEHRTKGLTIITVSSGWVTSTVGILGLDNSSHLFLYLVFLAFTGDQEDTYVPLAVFIYVFTRT